MLSLRYRAGSVIVDFILLISTSKTEKEIEDIFLTALNTPSQSNKLGIFGESWVVELEIRNLEVSTAKPEVTTKDVPPSSSTALPDSTEIKSTLRETTPGEQTTLEPTTAEPAATEATTDRTTTVELSTTQPTTVDKANNC